MPDTIRMHHVETGKTADVHPAEVENWKRADWRVSDALPPPPASKPSLKLPPKQG